MNDSSRSKFLENWGCIVIGVVFVALTSICPALGEKRPVGAFAEIFFARLLIIGGGFVALFLAIYVKEVLNDATGQSWLAWILAIVTFLVLVCGSIWVGSKIPGVNWRIKHFAEDMSD